MKIRTVMLVMMLLLSQVGGMGGVGSAWAARVADLTTLGGDVSNDLIGFGLVAGLKGTGDGGDYGPAMKPLAQLLTKMGDPITVAKELKNSNNVAIVQLSVSVPAKGVREGQKLDIKVSSVGAAKSLKGGRLIVTPLTDALGKMGIVALAAGDLTLGDEGSPTQAVIRAGAHGGANFLTSFAPDNVDTSGRFELVLTPQAEGFANTTAIADQINEDVNPQTGGKPVATAIDAVTVLVQIPAAELARPAQFISRIQALPVPTLPQIAKITINPKTKTIVFSGDVELTPTTLLQGNLTVTVPSAPADGTAGGDAAKSGGGVKLSNLIDSFNLLKVSPDDRISIIKQLHENGALRCQLEID
ncbi:MAG: flagellar basal body P-ring protein FlgI [Phycisphaerae bacterium]